MHFTSALVLYSMLHAAATASASCNANNCLRAVRGDAFPTRHGTLDCSSYFMATVTEATITSTSTGAHTTTTTVEHILETIFPTGIPAYASACSGSVGYSSACSCISVTHATTTVLPTQTINTSTGYVIVSPSSCPPSTAPTGIPIGQSNSSFSAANGGLQYQQFAGSQFIIQNGTSGPFYVDLSSSSQLVISDTTGDTLIIYSNGSFAAFAGHCELEIVGSWSTTGSGSKEKRNALERRQSSGGFCSDIQLFCDSKFGVGLQAAIEYSLCLSIDVELGAAIGEGVGFLGFALGPEVGIPTTLAGEYLGGLLGSFIAGKLGQGVCAVGAALVADSVCKACPSETCGFGTISCNGGPCQDGLTDPNNCGKCGKVCTSGVCQNGACSNPTCNGASCGGIQSCTGDCFCFEGASTVGFCGQNTPCASDPPCSSDADCAQGSVCAVNTCCGSSICLAVCSGQTGKRETGFVERTLGGMNASYPAGVPPPGF